MSYLLDIIACGLVVAGELIGALLLMLTIQFIFYKVFKINIYKLLIKSLNNLDKYLTAKLG